MTATYTVNCSILLTELPLLDRPGAARNAGFEAVEFWWPFDTPTPPDADVTAFIRAIQDAGVQLTGLNFAAGDMPAGDRGILSNPAMTQAFRDNVEIAVGIAESLGTRAFNALYGNRIEEYSPATQDQVGAENLAYAARGGPHRRDDTGRTRKRRTTISPHDGRRRCPRDRSGALRTRCNQLATARRPLPPPRQRR